MKKPPILMQLMLIFALLLFAGVLISCRAQQSVLSTSVLFLVAGLLIGKFTHVQIPGQSVLYTLAEIALYSVLFSDGMKTGGIHMLRARWQPVVRALGVGMPINIAMIGALAHWLLAFGWRDSLALGAVLSPTDPVFVSAFLEVEVVPVPVKEILNIESGFNDGLALPAVFLLLPQVMFMQSGSTGGAGTVLLELVEGVAIGVAIPLVAIWVERLPVFGAAGVYERLNPFAIALITFAVCELVRANLFLAAFSAGLTVATRRGELHEAFRGFAEPVTELLKLATILIFTLRTASLVFSLLSWQIYVVAVAAAFLVRLAAVPLALVRSNLALRDRMLVAWCGPKGFASLVYGIMLLQASSPELKRAAAIVAITVVMSILVYSSTDVLLGDWLKRRSQPGLPSGQPITKKAGL